jgi:hypothetical protein
MGFLELLVSSTAVAGLCADSWEYEALLNILGAIEATFNKSKRRFTNMARRLW